MTHGSIMNGNINRFYHGEVNGNLNPPTMNVETTEGEKFEVPLPFGYHLDLDFLRVCSDELVSGENLQKLKELKKARRKQRKTLEALMGIKQEQKDREKRLRDLPATSRHTINLKTPPKTLQLDQPDIVNSSELVREALRESMLSFQETLDQYKEQNLSDFDLINTSTPNGGKKVNKFNTFPRIQNLGSPDEMPTGKLSRQLSNSSISSISTSSSALPYNTPLTPEAYLASLPSSVIPMADEMETNSIGSISSEMSTNTLRNVREQMARSLVKLKEYEKQVEAIPMLQVKLSVLKEEKRLLMLKLKAREAKLRKDRGEDEATGMGEDMRLYEEAMETDDEDLDMRVAKMSDSLRRNKHSTSQHNNLNNNSHNNNNSRRVRSESPYAKCTITNSNSGAVVQPEDFISFQRKRSTSCGFNSDNSDSNMSPTMQYGRQQRYYYNKDSPEFAMGSGRRAYAHKESPPDTVDKEMSTDPIPEPPKEEPKPRWRATTRERSVNTDPPPRSPPPPRKVNHGTNTLKTRSIPKGTATDIRMQELVSQDEVESKIQDAVF